MKTFKDYYDKNNREYKYTAKIATEISDEQKAVIENTLSKYELLDIGEFKKTPLQESPLDFPNIKNTNVTIVDFSIRYPGTNDMLENLLCNTLGLARSYVIVYTENDPRKEQTELWLNQRSPEYKEKYKTLFGNESPDLAPPTPVENGKLADYVKLKTYTNSLVPEQKIDPQQYPEQTSVNTKSVQGSKK